MATVNFDDFHQVQNLEFDILKLKKDLDKVLKDKKFNSPGVTHFGAIPINQIPNDKNSIEGNNIRGRYWTIADETGKEKQNQILSKNRAKSVFDILVSAGISANRLSYAGGGEDKSVTTKARQFARKVIFKIN